MFAVSTDAAYIPSEKKYVYRFNKLIEGSMDQYGENFNDNMGKKYLYFQPYLGGIACPCAVSLEFLNDDLNQQVKSYRSFPLYAFFSDKCKKFYAITSENVKNKAKKAILTAQRNAVAERRRSESVDSSKENFPTIMKYGRNLTEQEYPYFPAVTREEELFRTEIKLLQNKSILYTGPHGVGKSALVEGLSYLIQKGEVSEDIKKKTIIEMYVNSLEAGTQYRGTFEEKVKQIIDEAQKKTDVILFFDEMHTMLGAGTAEGQKLDLANTLKPYLARGEITIIGATTDLEFHKYFKDDAAFKSRFAVIPVKEPDRANLKRIILATLPYFEKKYKRCLASDVNLDVIIEASYHRKYDMEEYNPRLILDIIGDAFAISYKRDHEKCSIDDFVEALNMCSLLYPSAINDAEGRLKKGISRTRSNPSVIAFPEYLQK